MSHAKNSPSSLVCEIVLRLPAPLCGLSGWGQSSSLLLRYVCPRQKKKLYFKIEACWCCFYDVLTAIVTTLSRKKWQIAFLGCQRVISIWEKNKCSSKTIIELDYRKIFWFIWLPHRSIICLVVAFLQNMWISEPEPKRDNPYLDRHYSGYHKNHI